MIETDMTRAVAEKAQIDWAAQIPLGRLGGVTRWPRRSAFLRPTRQSYITGHVLAVNGGMYSVIGCGRLVILSSDRD